MKYILSARRETRLLVYNPFVVVSSIISVCTPCYEIEMSMIEDGHKKDSPRPILLKVM